MSKFQYNAYLRVLKNEENEYDSDKKKDLLKELNVADLPNNFYIGTRVISNIVFPNRKLGNNGLRSLTKEKILDKLKKYSTKFYEIMDRIERTSGKIFVYSSFKEHGGIKSFVKVLEAFGYSSYVGNGAGKKRYGVWSGDEDLALREEIKSVYNKPNNIKGHKLKILICSSAAKEGLSLTAVRSVHLLEPYWNQSRLDQIIGRSSRFCSHRTLPEHQRTVKVYIYMAVHPKIEQTVDQYMEKLIEKKSKIIYEFEKAIKESAIDCYLNKNANVDEGDEDINCEK